MKHLALLSLALLILSACSNSSNSGTQIFGPSEEDIIRDYINSKLTATAQKASDVEILSEDSVLSFTPLQIMQAEYLRTRQDSVLFKLAEYRYHATLARQSSLFGQKKTKELVDQHKGHWRRIVRVKVTAEDGHVSDNIEVIFDTDNITPFMTGNEYDMDLQMWQYKIDSLK